MRRHNGISLHGSVIKFAPRARAAHKKNAPSATQKGRSNLLRGTTLIPAKIRRTLNDIRNVYETSEPTVNVFSPAAPV